MIAIKLTFVFDITKIRLKWLNNADINRKYIKFTIKTSNSSRQMIGGDIDCSRDTIKATVARDLSPPDSSRLLPWLPWNVVF